MKLKLKKFIGISIVFGLVVTGAGTLVIVNKQEGNDTQTLLTGTVKKPPSNAASSSTPVQAAFEAKEGSVPGMEKAAENDTLALYMNKTTAELAVYDKRSGHVWYTNPQDRDQDAKASAFEKQGLASQLSLQFSDAAGNSKTFLSFNDAVDKKQFKVNLVSGGVQIEYTLGDLTAGIDALPKVITKERLDLFMAKIKKTDAEYVYRKYQIDASKTIYTRFDSSLKSNVALLRVTEAFKEAGYTAEDLAADNKANQAGNGADNAKPVFTVPVQYVLDGENLVAAIKTSELKEPSNYTISDINMLPYFSAGGLKDKGYMLVPDGSGSLIYLNNGKFSDDIYSQPVYGADEAIRKRTKPQNAEGIKLPVFGIKTGENAMYGIIEKGAALANINAEVSGRTNSYNYVYGSFTIRSWDELPMSNGQTFNYVPIVQLEKANAELSIRYGFLYGDDASYAGIAKTYQHYLVNTAGMKKTEGQEDVPFYVDIIGDIPKRKSILGIPYEAMEPLTTFSQAKQIAEEMKDNGIGNVRMRYLGWFNDGVNHELPDDISVDRKLGGRSGLEELNTYLKDNGAALYPDASFLTVYHDTWGFSPSKDASRYITRQIIEKYPYDPAYMRMNVNLGTNWLLSPAKLPSIVKGFISDYKDLDLNGLSLRDMGKGLDPDYQVSAIVNRQQSANIVTDEMGKLAKAAPDLLVSGGNAYSLGVAKHIVDAPLTDTQFNITDETVPFYQMVLHGYVSYTGKPFNLADSQDVRVNMLKALEYGSNIRFTWTYADASEVKETIFNNLYSVQYKPWLKDAASVYEEINAALKDVQNERMTSHTMLQEGVYATSYESGKTIVVNYTNEAVEAAGQSVSPMGYALLQQPLTDAGRGSRS
ncbi:DUF5696 domain-containing protein [Paenibacillus solisilvae]|uniref:DUF5696 domain-containing protein n=1 Tax=Paenibacillus solisilvae TaxID=2486751 RepID=A0ABW0W595_9BACL